MTVKLFIVCQRCYAEEKLDAKIALVWSVQIFQSGTWWLDICFATRIQCRHQSVAAVTFNITAPYRQKTHTHTAMVSFLKLYTMTINYL